jgi:hypothetical protein
LRHRFAKIEEIDDLRFEITAVTFSEGCFHAAYSLISWSNILAHLNQTIGEEPSYLRPNFGAPLRSLITNGPCLSGQIDKGHW